MILLCTTVTLAVLGKNSPIFIWQHDDRWIVSPQRGYLLIRWFTPDQHVPLPAPRSHFLADRRFAKIHYVVIDDYVETRIDAVHRIETEINILLWWLCVPFAVLPAIWMIWMMGVIRTRRRQLQGRCLTCGYDLRATPGRCPECGTFVAQPIAKD